MHTKQFWNDSYKDGYSYRQISDDDVALFLSKMSPKPKYVLEVGCGTGELARQLGSFGLMTTAIDISDEAINRAQKISPSEIVFKTLDVENDLVSDLGKFDLITMKLVFKFIQDKGSFIEKLRNLLNKNGYLVIINPVITNIELAPPKTINISLDDEITMGIAKLGFVLIDRTAQPLSKYHDLVTYIFKYQI